MKTSLRSARLWISVSLCGLGLSPVMAASNSTTPVVAPPLFTDIGSHSRIISGAKPETQRFFDQGVAFVTGFNHDEGLRAMQHATRLDPECAMAWWGVALACSPHINGTGVSAPRAKLAWDALAQAQKFSAAATAPEQALIRAMATRFSGDEKAKRRPLDEAYVAAMREVYQAHPADADIAAWFADAMMMLRPWDLWKKNGEAHPGTEEALAALDEALRLNPRHPLANHLAVHAHEASPQPGRADAAADRLRDLAPGLGHLVHMAAHIDVRRGRWDEAILVNTKSIAANRRYREIVDRPLSGYLGYMGHDYHMLTYAAMMSGRSKLAAQTMRDLFTEMPAEWPREGTMGDGYFAMHFEVMKRFGRWDEILAAPEPIEKYRHARVWRFLARGIALAAKGDPVGARAEERAFVEARAKVPAERRFGNRGALARRGNSSARRKNRGRAGRAAGSGRARGQAALRRAARLGATGAPRARGGVAPAGASRRSGGRLPRGSRADAGQRLVALRPRAGAAFAEQKSSGGGGFGSAVQARLGPGRCDADVVVLLPAGDVRQGCGVRPKPIRLQR
jgi:tetratricopeptide (TPR) repeat protein